MLDKERVIREIHDLPEPLIQEVLETMYERLTPFLLRPDRAVLLVIDIQEKLAVAVREPQELIAAIMKDVEEFANGRPADDDQALLLAIVE